MLSYGLYSLFQSDSSSFKRKIAAQTDNKLLGKTKGYEKPKQPERNPIAAAMAATTTFGVYHGQAIAGPG